MDQHTIHDGSHDGCFICKLRSLNFGGLQRAKHQPGGDPWKDNPVVDRIQELSGQAIDTDALTKRYVDNKEK